MRKTDILPIIRNALREDAAIADVTTHRLISRSLRGKARVIVKSKGVIAGVDVAVWVFRSFDPGLRCVIKRREGANVTSGDTVLNIHGRVQSIFAAERTALNILGHMSGIATLSREYADKARNTRAIILDTRKTLPGLRKLEKYAASIGGVTNHRSDLSEAVLVKTNHLRVLDNKTREENVRQAIRKARGARRRDLVEIEVSNLRECKAALEAKADIILLDNWRIDSIRKAVKLREKLRLQRCVQFEVSGGVDLKSVGRFARTGVERISIGRLTHSAPSLDVSLKVC